MKLIVIDLDGTLLNSDKKVSYESKKYLEQLKDEGYIIAVATGRYFKSAFLATDGAFFSNYIISNNGAAIFDNVNRKLLMRALIPFETAQSILELYHANIESIEFFDLFNNNIFSIDISSDDIYTKLEEMKNFLEGKENISNISICFNDDSTALEVNDYISKKYNDLNSFIVHCTYSKNSYIDILKKGISKYSAVREIAKIHNIKNEDIIAIGDSENDLEMIKNCGISVAMSNSFDIIKQNARYMTMSNDEDGVIEFLKLYL